MSKNHQKISLKILGLVSAFLFIILAIFSLLNNLVADDYMYFGWIEQNGFFGFLDNHFNAHTARFAQSLLVGLGYLIFGTASVKIIPLFCLIALIATLSWAVYRFLPLKQKSKLTSFIIGSALASLSAFLFPSLYDSYLWLTASSIYLTSIIVLVLNLIFIDILIKSPLSKTKQILIFLFIFLSQSFLESASLFMILASATATIYFFSKKATKKATIFLRVTLTLLLGFIISFIISGSFSRHAAIDPTYNFLGILPEMLGHFKNISASLYLWQIVFLFAISALISILLKPITREFLKNSLKVAGFFLFFFVFGYFTFFGFVGEMVVRAYALPSFVLTVSAVIILSFMLNIYFKNHSKYLIITSSIFLLLALPSFFRFSQYHFDFLIERNAAINSRAESIESQISENFKKIAIEELPVLVFYSETTDLACASTADWSRVLLKNFYKLPEDIEIEILPTPENYFKDYGINYNRCPNWNGDHKIEKSLKSFFFIY